MALFETLLNVVVPAFVVIGVGVLLGRFLGLDLVPLNRAALYAAVPALVFTSLARTELGAGSVGRLVVGQLIFLTLMLGLSYLASRPFEARTGRGFMATSLYGNSANLMLPVTLFALGEAGLERALVLFVVSSIALFGTGPLVLAGGRGANVRLTSVLRLPVLWAALVGVLFNLLGLSFPQGLARGIGILSDAAIPLVLLVLGMQIHRSGLKVPTPVNWAGAGFKLVVGPVLGYLAARIVGATGLDLAVLTLLGAMPPAVNTFMLALEFGGNAEEVARTVVLATLLALLSLSVVVTLIT